MPAAFTIIDELVSPVFHNRDPVAVVDNVELPQLSTTVTTGAGSITFGAAIPEPAALVQPSIVCVTV